MKSFPDKVKEARCELGLSQADLADMAGVSARSVIAYEKGEKKPRPSTLLRLSRALRVSVKFLSDDECGDPLCDIEKDGYISAAYARYGSTGAHDAQKLLADNTALFAGGELSQEQKDAFFEAIMRAYIDCKEAAKKRRSKE